jgi:surface polysaccharide O-acyltransferase-like enzyme
MLTTLTDEQWRSFTQVDVLQLIGATFLIVQALVFIMKSRRAFTIAVFALAIAAVAFTHPIWVIDWWQILPGWLAAYLSPARGSLFPLFPWAAYVLFGAGMGQIYVSWGAARLSRYAIYALFVPGVVLSALGWGLAQIEEAPWGPDAWNFMPIQLAIRIGACLILLAAIAQASQRLKRLPRLFAAVAQETLAIYFVHLMIVYGSIWNSGLAVWYAASLGPAATLACVVFLLASMAALGWYWHWLKHAHPILARWTMAGVAALLVTWLL